MPSISKKVKNLPPSGIRKFFDLIRKKKEVISLGVGEPDFTTPWHIREACIFSLEKGMTMYTSNSGLEELREEICRYYKKRYNLKYNSQKEILITVGVSEALDLALRAIIEPGDEVIIPEPCYVSYKPIVILSGGIPKTFATTKTNFIPDVKEMEKIVTKNTKAIILGYPNNPTGVVLRKKELEKIAEFVKKYNLIVISDEIYAELTYEGEHISIAQLKDMQKRTILLNGFSKSYAMTGWRIGYALSSAEIIAGMTKIHQYTMLCAPIMSQFAALEAIKNGNNQMQEMKEEYNQRREIITDGLNKIGLYCRKPEGAFYVFPSIKKTCLSSEEFSYKLLEEENVAVVPGVAFGECGEGYIRISYATSLENIEESLNRMERFVKKYTRRK